MKLVHEYRDDGLAINIRVEPDTYVIKAGEIITINKPSDIISKYDIPDKIDLSTNEFYNNFCNADNDSKRVIRSEIKELIDILLLHDDKSLLDFKATLDFKELKS